ncbi:MAG: hypothetical protein KIT36_03560 [Alphaproteobacteria bacterium]|nr:hypothetical protein [Alphaproteobacteria bacterium]
MLVLAAGVPGPVQAQQHWLVGTWVGKTETVRAYGDTGRTLTVRAVSADGTSATGTWDAGGPKLRAQITIAGDRVSFVVGAGNAATAYALTRRGNRLTGTRTMVNSGTRTNVTLERQ